MIDKEDYFE